LRSSISLESGGIVQKVNYEKLRAELVHYVRPDKGRTEPLETLTDGILERLVIAGLLDPERIEGWPENGMVQPLLAEMRGASA
jgi:hypothetical protein